jgi:transcriptional regulator with XRE-family HTH domain
MSAQPSGPTAMRRKLGEELRRRRNVAGMTMAEAARVAGCAESRISRIETAKQVARPGEVEALCALYGADQDTIEKLLGMLSTARQADWWEQYGDVLPPGLAEYVGLESDARAERAHETVLVHGILQTPDYARAILESWPDNSPADIDDLVKVRVHRAGLLTRENAPLELWAVFNEAVIRQRVGGPEVMREQLHHLVDAARAPHVTIQVIPERAGAHPGLGGAFSLLAFEEDSPIVYVDSPAGNLYLRKKADVRRFERTYTVLQATALSPDESIALIRTRAEEMQ